MEYLNYAIGAGVLAALVIIIYMLYQKLHDVRTRLDDLDAAHSLTLTEQAMSGHATGHAAVPPARGGQHGQLREPVGTNGGTGGNGSGGKRVRFSEPSECTTEGTMDHHTEASDGTASQVVIYGQRYGPVPDEVDNVSLRDIDNVSEFPCDLTLVR